MSKDLANAIMGIVGKKVYDCMYGENPQQNNAALYQTYKDTDRLGLAEFEILTGQPSYNNLCDLDRALQTITHIAAGYSQNFEGFPYIAVGVKHGNACGVGVHMCDPQKALTRMILGNTEDIFGGIVITNFTIGEFDAEILQKCGMPSGKRRVLDSVICPSIFENAVELLRRKNDKCRIIRNPALKGLNHRCIDTNLRARSVRGGWLTQDNYTFVPNFQDTRFQKHGPMITDPDLRADMLLAWAIGSTSTSNTVTIVKDKMLIGNGAGQTSRKTAAWLAVQLAKRAGHDTTGAAAYSDSFFPFVDAPLELINAGVTAIFTSSGSIGDRDVIALCDENNVSLYMIPDKIGRGFYGG